MGTVTASSVLVSVMCIVVVTVIIKVMNFVWFRPKKLERLLKQYGFSGTPYKFLTGDLNDFISMRAEALKTPMNGFSNDYYPRIEPFRHQLATKFGNEFFLWMGPIPTLQISNPEMLKEALTKTDIFPKVKLNPILDKLFPGFGSFEGEKWAKHRKLINPAFHVEKLKLMVPTFRICCEEVISKWEKVVAAERGSGELDVNPDLIQLTADAISRTAFGSNYQEGQKIFLLLKEQIDLTLPMLQSIYLPGMRYIPTARNRRFKNIDDQIHTSLRTIINKRKEETEAREAVKTDLLGILLDSNFEEVQRAVANNKNHQNVGMSLEEVIDECKLFYLVGQETTSTLLVWTMILLSKHQEWQARAREEVFQTFGDNVPDSEGLSHLKTVTMILYEVLRLYPPVAQILRWVNKDTTLGVLSIPSNMLITFYMDTVHRDQELWGDDAQEFRPDRFADGISMASKGSNSFFPFGWGPRICIGEKFAMTEAKIVISMFLQRFSFELSPSYVHAPSTVLFLQPQHGAKIILHKL